MAHAMLPGVPARELQENNMIENVNALRENHEEVALDRLQSVQEMIDREDEDMGQLEYQHPPGQQPQNQQERQQVMSPRERERQQQFQAYALQD